MRCSQHRDLCLQLSPLWSTRRLVVNLAFRKARCPKAAMIPHLETERLVLREFRAGDFEAYASFMADPEVARYIAPAPMSREDAWRSLASTIGHWTLRGYGTWAVQRKEDGAFMGRV